MPRKPRLVVPGAPHHLYLRGNNRRLLFSSRADRLFFIACLLRALDATKCVLHQLTLMGNHVHAIVTPPSKKALSDLVKRACQRYAQKRNEKRGGSGKLFEERYRVKVITDEAQLRITTLYNDANAFRAGIVDDALTHEWSTGPLHAGGEEARMLRSIWTPSRWYTQLGATPEARALSYRQHLAEYLDLRDDALIDEDIREVEREDTEAYALRLRRPDGSSAGEDVCQYGRKAKKLG
jgi:putative transposase